MKVCLSEKIKELRRAKKWTQEDVAERLNVSVQAVSRWETGATYPDIELLPEISSIFEISVDELLGVDENIINKKVERCIEEAFSNYSKGNIAKMVNILEKALQENPSNVKLSLNLIIALSSLYEGDRKSTCERIIKLGNKIINRLSDLDDKCSLYQIMAYTYLELGDNEKAKELAYKLPNIAHSSNFILPSLLEGNEKVEFIQYNIQSLVNNLVLQILKITKTNKYTEQEKILMLDKINSLFELIYENKDYGYEAYLLARINIEIAELYANNKDVNNTCCYLDKAYNYAVNFDNVKIKKVHNSLLNNKTEFDLEKAFGKDYKEREIIILSKRIKDSKFDFIRENSKFKEIVKKFNN